jgi:hypothetical protein
LECRILKSSEWRPVQKAISVLETLLAMNDARLAEQTDRDQRRSRSAADPHDFTSSIVPPTPGGVVHPDFAALKEALSRTAAEGADAIIEIDIDWLRVPGADMITARKQIERSIVRLRNGDVCFHH